MLQRDPTPPAHGSPYRLPISRCQVRSEGVECARNVFLDPRALLRDGISLSLSPRTSHVYHKLHNIKVGVESVIKMYSNLLLFTHHLPSRYFIAEQTNRCRVKHIMYNNAQVRTYLSIFP